MMAASSKDVQLNVLTLTNYNTHAYDSETFEHKFTSNEEGDFQENYEVQVNVLDIKEDGEGNLKHKSGAYNYTEDKKTESSTRNADYDKTNVKQQSPMPSLERQIPTLSQINTANGKWKIISIISLITCIIFTSALILSSALMCSTKSKIHFLLQHNTFIPSWQILSRKIFVVYTQGLGASEKKKKTI